MRKAWLATLTAILLSPAALGACKLPSTPTKVPDGATASDPEMRGAMQTLKRYDSDITAYIKCLEFEVRQSRLAPEEKARLANVALDRLTDATKRFNEQMRIFMGH